MKPDFYHRIFQNAPCGFAHHKIILNDAGNPCDYHFIAANKAFEKLTGLDAQKIAGKTAKEVFPDIIKCDFDWIGIYGEVAATRKPQEFEQYFEPLKRWYKIEVFSPETGFFTTLFTDITKAKNSKLLTKQQPKHSENGYAENIQNLIDAIPDMIIVMHRDGTILEIHGEDPEKLIAPADKLIGTSIKDCFEEEEFYRHIKMYEQCISRKETGIIEFSLYINNLKQFFESRIKPLDHERLLTIVRDITDRVDAENNLAASEEKYRMLFNANNDSIAIFYLDDNGKPSNFIEMNEAGAKIIGYEKDELLQMDAPQLEEDLTDEVRNKRIEDILNTGQTSFETVVHHKSGKRIMMDVKAIMIEYNNRPAILNISRDITERKHTEQKIAKNQKDLIEINRIGLIANSTLDLDALLDLILKSVVKTLNAQVGMIFLKDPDHNQFKWGASLGLSEAFITDFKNRPIRFGEGLTGTIAKTGEPVFIPENSSHDDRIKRSVVKNEGLNSFIGVPVFAGDEVIGIMNILTRPPALLSKDNLHTCAAIGSQIGLAIRNARLFEEHKLAQEAVQKSNQRLESLLNISRQITSSINQEEIMQMIVDNAIRIMGLETGAVYLKKDEATIKLSATSPALPVNFPDDLRIAFLSDHPHIGKAMKTGKHVLMADSASANLTPEEQNVIDFRKLKTNLYLPIQIREKAIGVLILSSSEEPKVFTSEELNLLQGFANQAAHIIDNAKNYAELKKYALELEQQIKQREKAERELIIAKEKAEESNRVKTAFINNISHEVRTPLNGILGFGNLIMEKDISSAEKQDYYNLLQHSSERLQQTITDIVDISEITAGTITPREHDVSLSELLFKLGESTREACSKKNILVMLEVPPQHKNLVLQTDEELLVKIMKHLLSNAEKFTASGRISLGYDVQDKWVHFFVRDTGQGISTDKLNLMFEPFMQEDVSITRGHEGSGLGLSIARGLVELLGGKLWAESKKGEGSTFFFALPYLPAEQKAEPKKPVSATSEKSGNNLILIAEDEESNYMLLKTVAERAGFSTLHAIHGAEAVELCHQYPEIGLILMDIKMPVMNGLEATKQIKAFRPGLPIIALTAHAQTGDRQRMIDAGCDEYLAKPMKVRELQVMIRKMIV